jgi:hypothetical protein
MFQIVMLCGLEGSYERFRRMCIRLEPRSLKMEVIRFGIAVVKNT